METQMNTTMKSFLAWLFLLQVGVGASVLRHNEQGLTSSHTYKQLGPNEVVSNANGNLVLTEVAAEIDRPDLSLRLVRSFNSHWRDPQVVFQYDLNFSHAMGDSVFEDRSIFCNLKHAGDWKYLTTDGAQAAVVNDFLNHGCQKKTQDIRLKDIDPPNGSWFMPRTVGGFVHGKNYSVASALALPFNWYGIGNMAFSYASQINNLVSVANQTANDVKKVADKQVTTDKFGSWVGVGGESFYLVGAFLNNGVDETFKDPHFYSAASSALAMGLLQNNQAVQTFGLTNKAAVDAAAKNLSYAFAVLNYVIFLTEWDPNAPNAPAVLVGETFAMAATIVATESPDPVTITTAIVVDLAVLTWQMLEMESMRYDLGEFEPAPWGMAVNGYMGMVGIKYQEELSSPSNVFGHVDGGGFAKPKSLHPMAEMWLINETGGAEQFVLNRGNYTERDGARYYAYTPLSAKNHTIIYYVDNPQFQSDRAASLDSIRALNTHQDSTGKDVVDYAAYAQQLEQVRGKLFNDAEDFYLVKKPDGTYAKFGVGADKGVETQLTKNYNDPFELYWALPSSFHDYQGDSIVVNRGSDHQIVSIGMDYVNADPRSVQISRTSSGGRPASETVTTLDGSTTISQKTFTFAPHNFDDGKLIRMEYSDLINPINTAHRAGNDTVDMVTSITESNPGGTDLVTSLEYQDGNLVRQTYPNGSVAEYTFDAAKLKSTADGNIRKKVQHAGPVGGGASESWEYSYDGLDKGTANYLQTTVRTTLDNGNGVYDPKEDQYRFSMFPDTQYIYLEDGKKPRSYATYRINPFYESIGNDGVGQITTSVYQHDQLVYQSEKTGLQGKRIGLLTSYSYDSLGNMILEAVNPSMAVDAATRQLYNKLTPSTGASQANADPVNRNSLQAALGTVSVDDIGASKLDLFKIHIYYSNLDHEFYLDSVYKGSGDDSIKQFSQRIMNPKFDPYGRYIIGFKNGEGIIQKNLFDTLHGNYLELKLTSLDTARYLRPVQEKLILDSNTKFTTKEYFYNDPQNPYFATQVRTWLGPDSFMVDSIVPDPVFHLLPSVEGKYTRVFHVGDAVGAPDLTIRHVYDAKGLETSVTDFAGGITTKAYDGLGRLLLTTYPDGSTETVAYNDRLAGGGASQTTTDRNGVKTRAVFDGLGRLVTVATIGKDGKDSLVDTYAFNVFNKVGHVKLADGTENTYDYDKLGRVTTLRTRKDALTTGSGDVNWIETQVTYRDDIATVIVTDPMGHITRTKYDPIGNPIVTTTAISGTDSLVDSTYYDNQGHVVHRTDPRGLHTTAVYGWLGKPTNSRYPDGQSDTTNWDLLGNPLWKALSGPGGSDTSAYSYDGVGRLTSVSWNAANAAWNRSLKYDSTRAGQLARVLRNNVASSFDYDTYGNLKLRRTVVRDSSAITLADLSATFAYNKGATRSQLGLPGNAYMAYLYDNYNRLQGLDFVQGTITTHLMSNATYRGLGLRTGYSLGETAVKIDYEASRPLVLGMKATNTNFTTSQSMVWDRAGNLTNWTHPDGEKASYAYDWTDRLTGVDYPSGNLGATRPHSYQYAYDKDGNPTKYVHDYGTLSNAYPDTKNQISTSIHTARNATKYTFDHRGNRASETAWADSSFMNASGKDTLWTSKRTYSWSPENEMVAFKDVRRRCGVGTDVPQCNGIAQTDSSEYRYSYDENNRKILTSKIINGTWTPVREYLWDGVQVAYEKDLTTNASTYFAVDGINHVAEVHVDSNNHREILYRLNDHLGNLQQLLDSTGKQVAWYRHEPYGRLEGYAGTRSSRYTWGAGGKEYVEELGWMDFGRRYYDVNVGAWVSRDPDAQFNSLYAMGTNPLNSIDVDGMDGINIQFVQSGTAAGVGGGFGAGFAIDLTALKSFDFKNVLYMTSTVSGGVKAGAGESTRLTVQYTKESPSNETAIQLVKQLTVPVAPGVVVSADNQVTKTQTMEKGKAFGKPKDIDTKTWGVGLGAEVSGGLVVEHTTTTNLFQAIKSFFGISSSSQGGSSK